VQTHDSSPATGAPRFNVAAQADRVAESAARRAAVSLTEVHDVPGLRAVSALLEAVWGRTDEGVPVNTDVLRSLVHAGGCVTAAHDVDGDLVSAAVLSVAAPAGTTYSLIAAVAPGTNDRGIGRAVKLRQRAWALQRDYRTMLWTFDPLVGRNARFNLARLGAEAAEYEVAFYGRMSDAINGDDDSDRLVARWRLDARRTVAATEGTNADLSGPAADAPVLAEGPDGAPMVRRDQHGLWCRVPSDIVELRRRTPAEAARWRLAVRAVLADAFAAGSVATHMTRDGWYLLTDPQPTDEEVR
jgi:predicted GNAT superfamily acetyltransferase